MLVYKIIIFFLQFILFLGVNKVNNINLENNSNRKVLMNLEINKINVKQDVFEKESVLNNIDKNVIILNDSDLPTKEKGIVLLGAHSGTGKYAYFKDLDKLVLNDIVNITYNNEMYKYKIISKYLSDKKNGIDVNYNVNKKRLVLYTCNPNDKKHFLIIICEII